nr:hypothetical protein [Tanacetum cinerariifolium]
MKYEVSRNMAAHNGRSTMCVFVGRLKVASLWGEDIRRFLWVRKKKKSQHLFSEIGRKVSYDVEVTAFVEDGRMRNSTGVKSKELFIWVGISNIFVGDHNNGKITFATSSSLSRTFPVSAFQ